MQQLEVKPVEPVFTDYDKDMSKFEDNGIEVLYKKNERNGIAQIAFKYDKGLIDDPALDMAFTYLEYLGTSGKTAEEIAREMYSLACDFNFRVSNSETMISVSGLSENLGKAIDIVEDLLAGALADDEILESLKADILKQRQDAKLNMRSCYNALQAYVYYGPEYAEKTVLTNSQLMSLSSEDLLAKVRDFLGYEHIVCYYGPENESGAKALLSEHHKVPENPQALQKSHIAMVVTDKPVTYIVNYDSRQFNYIQFSNRGEKYDASEDAAITLFNEYFGAGMNTIVFQEMRESRALAYSARARLNVPAYTDDSYSFYAYIGSQNDKLVQAVTAFDEIINNMPEEQNNFDIALSSLDSQMRTNRVTGINVLNKYLSDKELGIEEAREKAVFKKLGTLTMEDLVLTQQKWIKDRSYIYGIVGDVHDLDINFLKTLGPVKILSAEEVFGY